jgi:hypothetical protein
MRVAFRLTGAYCANGAFWRPEGKMNIFNRIVMLLLSLALLAFGGTVFVLLTGLVVPGNDFLRSLLALYTAWRSVALLRGATTNVAALVALGLAIIGLVVLILELLPMGRLFRRREGKQYVVRQGAVGQVTLGSAMVHDFVQHVAETVPGVVRAEPTVKDGEGGLHISTRASLAWDADAPAVGQMLQDRIKESVQSQLGLPVAEVSVTAQAAPAAREQPRPRVA